MSDGEVQFEKPHTSPAIGCACCGGWEMRTVEVEDQVVRILCRLETPIIAGFGVAVIERDGVPFHDGSNDTPRAAKRLHEIERLASADPDHDWRFVLDLPLRSAVYQRQGPAEWVLVETGKGFA